MGYGSQSESLDSTVDLLMDKVYAATQSILYKNSVLLTDKDLRSQISKLINMISEWYNSARESPRAVNMQRIGSIESYIGYVNQSIQSHLGEQTGAPNVLLSLPLRHPSSYPAVHAHPLYGETTAPRPAAADGLNSSGQRPREGLSASAGLHGRADRMGALGGAEVVWAG